MNRNSLISKPWPEQAPGKQHPLDKCAEKGIVVFKLREPTPRGQRAGSSDFYWPRETSHRPSPGLLPQRKRQRSSGKRQVSVCRHGNMRQDLGVVGLGAIGRKVAASASALGMNILGFDPYFTGEIEDVKIYSTIEDMLPECDYVTIHVPATDSTKGMFNQYLFDKMKASAVLLNFSRDKLVKDDDLLAALESGKLAAYVTVFLTTRWQAAGAAACGSMGKSANLQTAARANLANLQTAARAGSSCCLTWELRRLRLRKTVRSWPLSR
ncbi:MAG: NAD(P)-dependent oxidoreductase [Anaerovoracaceae bacterium]